MTRTRTQTVLYFVRWQLVPVLLALPAHVGFIVRGLRVKHAGVWQRAALAGRFLWIHLRVQCGHNPAELLHVVEAIIELSPEAPGIVVECGSFLGGSTAKLGHAAALARRELVVCDSFEGLPEVSGGDHSDRKPDFHKGEYGGRLEEVARTVARFGRLDRTRFVKGWFDETLGSLSGTPIVCAFWDVDLQESFRSCIRALWSSVTPGSKVFLHDVDRESVVAVFADKAWWRAEVGIEPPKFVGALRGLGASSPLIGYVLKA